MGYHFTIYNTIAFFAGLFLFVTGLFILGETIPIFRKDKANQSTFWWVGGTCTLLGIMVMWSNAR